MKGEVAITKGFGVNVLNIYKNALQYLIGVKVKYASWLRLEI